MNKKVFTYQNIIYFFLFINIILFLYGYFLGLKKPFWIDELHAIGFSKKIPNFRIDQIFSESIHSPFYFLLLTIFQKFLNFFNLSETEDLFYLRLINVIGFIPILWGFIILKKNIKEINLGILFLLLISSHFFFHYSLDLKMYFLLLSFSFLVNVINLTNTVEKEHKYLFLFSSIILSLLHVFGLTIVMSILLVRFIMNLSNRKYYNCKIDFLFSLLLLVLFIVTFYLATADENNLKSIGWIKIELWYFKVFIRWTFNTIIFILLISILLIYLYRQNILNLKNIISFFKSSIFKKLLLISLPSIILFLITLVISLKIPVLNYRNLIVVFPAGVLISCILGSYFFKLNKFKYLLIVFFISLSFINFNSYFKEMVKSGENIEWVIRNTFTEECENAIIYLNDRNKVFWEKMVNPAVDIYADYYRPIIRLTSFNKEEFIKNKNKFNKCKTFISSFHYRNIEEELLKINSLGFGFKTIYAPNVLYKNTSTAGVITIIE